MRYNAHGAALCDARSNAYAEESCSMKNPFPGKIPYHDDRSDSVPSLFPDDGAWADELLWSAGVR